MFLFFLGLLSLLIHKELYSAKYFSVKLNKTPLTSARLRAHNPRMRYDFTKVRAIIRERGLTQAEVGTLTGLRQATISGAFLRGTAHQRTAKALARVFRVPLKSLVCDTEKNSIKLVDSGD